MIYIVYVMSPAIQISFQVVRQVQVLKQFHATFLPSLPRTYRQLLYNPLCTHDTYCHSIGHSTNDTFY